MTKKPQNFFRDMIFPHIAEGAFLRRDRGDALYITNSPAKGKEVDIPGFSVESDGKIARISIRSDHLETFARQMEFSEDILSRELSHFCGGNDDSATLFAEMIKTMENPPGADIFALEKRLRQTAAAALFFDVVGNAHHLHTGGVGDQHTAVPVKNLSPLS